MPEKYVMTFKEWLKYDMPIQEVIINASPDDGSDRFVDYMIGVSIWCDRKKLLMINDKIRSEKVNTKLHCTSFGVNTDRKRRGNWGRNEQPIRRQTIYDTLSKKGFGTTSSGEQFFDDIVKSKFTFSPEGNGLDCHRHYEALITKSIPIVEYNDLIQEKYRGLPVVYSKDYTYAVGLI